MGEGVMGETSCENVSPKSNRPTSVNVSRVKNGFLIEYRGNSYEKMIANTLEEALGLVERIMR